ncbi:hypothetical protein PV382_40670 [Streptomyces scabiei]|uniref:hypothetical protein n=1 Tax=Streptomyces scabiei TaxID=1930 RepID=UPI0029A5C35D|nr:hypothetical protein [Streptomyces scabiei]MDX2999635.1 hypothetical protein [Streptomyces scabiei]MDX3035119.1 hypothetical protein [Streptomyces scabiei]MDX3053164.1 hypothetical protein [Streptomyces scabiei]MDX3144736.1 hypothetical protein [Streptomyces scabiei]MDX3178513.1 hypothetical protein [Streptomyces scabiei]
MALRFIAKDPNTDGANCPTVWVDEERQELVMQGWKVDEATRADCLTTGPIPDSEEVVRLPMRMVTAIREACDAADRPTVQ